MWLYSHSWYAPGASLKAVVELELHTVVPARGRSSAELLDEGRYKVCRRSQGNLEPALSFGR